MSSCQFINTDDNNVYVVEKKFNGSKSFSNTKLNNILYKMKDCKVFEYTTEKIRVGVVGNDKEVWNRKRVIYDMEVSDSTVDVIIDRLGINLEQFTGESYIGDSRDGYERYQYENVYSDGNIEYYTLYVKNDKIKIIDVYHIDKDRYVIDRYYNIRYI